jgi:hypothetical protein
LCVGNAQLLFNQLPAVGLSADTYTYTLLLDAIGTSQRKHKLKVGHFELNQTQRQEVGGWCGAVLMWGDV